MTQFGSPPSWARSSAATTPPHTSPSVRVPRTASPAVEALAADPSPERRASFWRRVAYEGTPLVEDVDGSPDERVYTFVHRDHTGARGVLLDVNKLADASTYRDALMSRVPGTALWSVSLRMPADWRASYGICVDDGGGPTVDERTAAQLEERRRRTLEVTPADLKRDVDAWYDLLLRREPDPLAREHALLGHESVASGPAAPALPGGIGGIVVGEQAAPGARGRTMPDSGLGPGRKAWWHVPPVEPGPDGWDVLVLLDGDRWLGAGLRVLDQVFAAGLLRPAVVLLVAGGDMSGRIADLTCSPDYVRALVRLLAGADPRRLGGAVTTHPARTTIVGQSLGGLTALYAQCVAPERFGASVCQSGSWWWPTRPSDAGPQPGEWLRGAVETAAQDAAWRLDRVYLEVGSRESVLLDPTRRLRDALDGRCEQLRYSEFEGGHDLACWAVNLPGALMSLAR